MPGQIDKTQIISTLESLINHMYFGETVAIDEFNLLCHMTDALKKHQDDSWFSELFREIKS